MPSLAQTRDLTPLPTPLRTLPSSVLLAEVMLDISFELTTALRNRQIGTDSTRRELFQTLNNHLIAVDDRTNGMRRVSVCRDRAVFLIPIQPGGNEHQDIFPPASACGLAARPYEKQHSPIFWDGLSPSQWHILILDWLRQELTSWMGLEKHGITPAIGDISREIAIIAAKPILDHVPALEWLLLDAMGYSRDLVHHCKRNQQRDPVGTSTSWQTALIRHWDSRQYWAGRSLKLFPLALAMADENLERPADPSSVRDWLRESGLSRNAWGFLYRLPAPVIRVIANDLLIIRQPEDRFRYLQGISLWFSRMGKQFRYYQSDWQRVVCTLVWPAREMMFITSNSPLAAASAYIEKSESRLFRTTFQGLESLLRRQHYTAQQQAQLQYLLLSFSRHALTAQDSTLSLFSGLQDIMDWFRTTSDRQPLNTFKRPYLEIKQLSDRWHTCLREQEAAALEAEILARVERPTNTEVNWKVSVPQFKHGDFCFDALLTPQALRDEGVLMHNCVGSYVAYCASGTCLIYAVSHNGARVGTLELCRNYAETSWEARQFKGKCNLELIDDLYCPPLSVPFKKFMAALQPRK